MLPSWRIPKYISSVSITNINSILKRIEGSKNANLKTKKILQLVRVENVGQTSVLKVSSSKLNDFEDAVQNFCAVEAEHEIIVTRNTKDFNTSDLSIMTSKEFITKMNTLN